MKEENKTSQIRNLRQFLTNVHLNSNFTKKSSPYYRE